MRIPNIRSGDPCISTGFMSNMEKISVPQRYTTPELAEINRLPMHGGEIPYADVQTALRRKREDSPWFLSLDGKWEFSLYHAPAEVPEDFAEPSCRCPEKIQVPSYWTLAGFFDKPIYTNSRMPAGFPPPPDVPDDNPTGIYRRTFRIPASWKNRRVVLNVGGAESYLEVYLNGAFVGMGKDSRLASEFDLTPFLKNGNNLLVCKVIRWSDSSFVEDQDEWWMAGIYRSVYLYSTAGSWLEDVFVNGDFDEVTGKGTFFLHTHAAFQWEDTAHEPGFFGRNETGPREDCMVAAVLYDGQNRIILQESAVLSHSFRESGYVVEKTFEIDRVQPWSSESPNLYTAVVSLLDPSGRILDCRSKRVGFRNIRIDGCNLLFNGKRVLIRGVNRHEHSMIGGKTLSMDEMLADIRLLKQFNFNAVRASHYPNDPRWYDLCDEYGIYVLDEANIESHACYSTLCRNPRWKNAWISRGVRMVLRDRSHACIFGWSAGNESGNGENHEALIRAVKQLDPTRIIHHEGELKEFWRQSGDMPEGGRREMNQLFDPMYSPLDFLRRYSENPRTDRPCVLSEYSHAMGNSCGSLCHYWELFRTMPKLQGGFIWDWIDQGLLIRGRNGKKMLAYGGDFGEKYHDSDFCCNGMITSDRKVHPAMYEFRHLAQPVKVQPDETEPWLFTLENCRDFSTLADLEGKWRLQVDGRVIAGGDIPDFASLPPQSTMRFSLPPPEEPVAGHEGYLDFRFTLRQNTAWAEAGTLLAHDQLNVTKFLRLVQSRQNCRKTTPALVAAGQRFLLRNGDTVLAVDRVTGKGTISHRGKTVLSKLFSCNLFRAGTDNDGIRGWTGQSSKPLHLWLRAGLDSLKVLECKVTKTVRPETGLRIRYILAGNDPGAKIHFQQDITAEQDGTFQIRQSYRIPGKFPSLPRVGVAAETVSGFETVAWYGRGPWENYSDRKTSAEIGKYTSSVTAMYENGYVLPQENGCRTDVRSMELTSEGNTILFTSDVPFSFNVSHYTDAELFAAAHQCELTPHKRTTVYLDLAQRGVGTGSCGPQTLPQYCLDGKQYVFTFRVKIS